MISPVRKGRWRPGIRNQFIIYLMVIGFIPVLIVGAVSYDTARDTVRATAGEYSQDIVSRQVATLEAQMEAIASLIDNLAGVEAITAVLGQSEAPETSDPYTALATQARIGYILNGYSNLRGLVSIELIDLINGHRFHVGDTLLSDSIREDVVSAIREQAAASTPRIWWGGIGANPNPNSAYPLVVSAARLLTRVNRDTLAREQTGLLIVNYDPGDLARLFIDINLGRDVHLVVVDGAGRVVYATDRHQPGDAFELAALPGLEAPRGSLRQHIDGEAVTLSFAQSAMLGWRVIAVIPEATLADGAAPIWNTTVLAVLSCFVLVGLAALRYNHNVVHPLADITGRFRSLQSDEAPDLTPVAVRGRDEIAELARWFNAFLVNLKTRQDMEARLRHDALHDALTGLPNRHLLIERLNHCMVRAHRSGQADFAVLFIDLDHFKFVNDSTGHEAGDRLLVAVAERLRVYVRDVDTVARLGGDEFVVLLDDLRQPREALEITERLMRAIRAPVRIGEAEACVSASVGIAFGHAETTQRPEELIRDADIAMYRAKARGKDCYEIFDIEMGREIQERLTLEMELQFALERGELCLYYQPLVHLADGSLIGFEALLRWRHPRLGVLSPTQFIDIAESNGQIVRIGAWVLETACRQLAQWREAGDGNHLSMHVNLSGRQVVRGDLVGLLRDVCKRYGLTTGTLHLEVTESLLIRDIAATAELLDHIRAMGIRVYIDDFGTGYSSLAYLNRLHVDGLKIDRSFISSLDDRKTRPSLVRAILSICRELDLVPIAEGVETEGQAECLRELGCNYAQGHLYATALTTEAATAFIRRATPATS